MKLFGFFISLILCLSLFSCSDAPRDAHGILDRIMESEKNIPAGVVYTPNAREGEEGYLSPALAEALWGEDAKEGFGMLEDYAVYISSFASPTEIGVFRCYSATDAIRIEQLCRARADIVTVALRQTEYHGLCRNARIMRRGDTVVFTLTEDPDSTLRLVKRLIR